MAAHRASRAWRRACVVRAQTAAADIRLVDLAVEPAYPEFEPGAVLDIVVVDAGVTSIHRHLSMPIGPGLLRISLRRTPEARHGARFLWSLVEGATIRVCSRAAFDPVVRPRDLSAARSDTVPGATVVTMGGGLGAAGNPAPQEGLPDRKVLTYNNITFSGRKRKC